MTSVPAIVTTAERCAHCAALAVGDPELAACICRPEVPVPFTAALIEPAPVDRVGRLEHLRRQRALLASARDFVMREADYQDRWDRVHAAELRADSRRYDRAERRISEEIDRLERQLRALRVTRREARLRSRRRRGGAHRRRPGRAPRPAGRRTAVAQRSAADGGGGGDGDPPTGDPDPAPAPSAGPTSRWPELGSGRTSADPLSRVGTVLSTSPVFSLAANDLARSSGSHVVRSACSRADLRLRAVASPSVVLTAAPLLFSIQDTSPRVRARHAPSTSAATSFLAFVLNRSQPRSLVLRGESENGHFRRSA